MGKIKGINIYVIISMLAISMVLIQYARVLPDTPTRYGNVNYKAIDVSIVAIIANPREYHGKLIRVIGVGTIAFERKAVHLSREHSEVGISKNALWLDLDTRALQINDDLAVAEMNGKYIIIEGVFNADEKGHFGQYSGTIENVSRYTLWEDW